jgi:ATP/maltotriose-dependent transcriptional regulator MalT
MNVWEWLRNLLGQKSDEESTFRLEKDLLVSLEEIADRERHPTDEIATGLLSQAIQERKLNEACLNRWEKLSHREQEITAFICLGYTNQQIATHLNITSETVKTHIRNIFYKLSVNSKYDLRSLLAKWDFNDWSPRRRR